MATKSRTKEAVKTLIGNLGDELEQEKEEIVSNAKKVSKPVKPEKKRILISLDEDIVEKGKIAAQKQARTFNSYVASLVLADLEAKGMI